MRLVQWMSGIGLGALCAAGLVVAPALQAQERDRALKPAVRTSSMVRAPGVFTPAAADPKLAAVLARSGMADDSFRFTPADARPASRNAVSVTARARSTRTAQVASNVPTALPASISLAPIAYNLGVSVGWKRFSVSGDVTKVEIVDQPGSVERADIGVSYQGKRLSGKLQATSDRPLPGTISLTGDKPSYSFDLGGSYSVSRNLNVTAGVRYKSERDRLTQLTSEQSRDSQAIYIGTAFRF
ncbi:hypothetical protein ACX40Y_03700 [Sphingomonas sp. RS6]